jgi:hypothetical protein
MKEGAILKQIKKHERLFNDALKKHLKRTNS